jgi:hypothetical protein
MGNNSCYILYLRKTQFALLIEMKRIYRIVALMMALLMFVTSTGFAVDMHYCQGQLKSFTLIGEAKSCHEVKADKVCPRHARMAAQDDATPSAKANDCCQNIKYVVQSDGDQIVPTADISLIQQLHQFVAVFVSAFLIADHVQTVSTEFLHYKPPLLLRDVCVLVQSFLL